MGKLEVVVWGVMPKGNARRYGEWGVGDGSRRREQTLLIEAELVEANTGRLVSYVLVHQSGAQFVQCERVVERLRGALDRERLLGVAARVPATNIRHLQLFY